MMARAWAEAESILMMPYTPSPVFYIPISHRQPHPSTGIASRPDRSNVSAGIVPHREHICSIVRSDRSQSGHRAQ